MFMRDVNLLWIHTHRLIRASTDQPSFSQKFYGNVVGTKKKKNYEKCKEKGKINKI